METERKGDYMKKKLGKHYLRSLTSEVITQVDNLYLSYDVIKMALYLGCLNFKITSGKSQLEDILQNI